MSLPIFQRTIVDSSGNIQPGASVAVRNETTGDLVTIYADREGGTAKANPFLADSEGFATFYVETGEYQVTATTPAGSITWSHVAIGDTALLELAQPTGSALVGFQQAGGVARTVESKLRESVSVKDFGAVGDGVTDDTSSIQAALNAAPAGARLHFPGPGRYRVGALTRTGALKITGDGGGKTQILFSGGGLTINNSAQPRNASFSAEGITFLADDLSLHTAIDYTGNSPGGVEGFEVRFESCQWSGVDRADGTGFTKSFKKCVKATAAPGVFFSDCFMVGPELGSAAAFLFDSDGIMTDGSNHLHIEGTHIYFFDRGVNQKGRQESHRIENSLIVACKTGIYARYGNLAADNIIDKTHVSSYECNIDTAQDVGTTVVDFTPKITSCSLYKRTASVGKFTYIKGAFQGALIHGNTFYAETQDSFTTQDEAIYIMGGARNTVAGNYFYFPWIVVRTGAGVVDTLINANMVYDRGETIGAPLVVNDDGIKSYVLTGNMENRNGPADQAKMQGTRVVSRTPDGISMYAEHAVPGTAAANYFRVFSHTAGNGPGIQAEGADANIDVRLIPKGSGVVRFGVRTASADAPITGYVEIKDAGGTLRRLAVIG